MSVGASSEMKPTGEPSRVATSVKCLPSRAANSLHSSAARGPGLLLRRVVIVLRSSSSMLARKISREQRRVLRQDTAAALICGLARGHHRAISQVVPSLESFSTTPMAASSSRMRSDSLKVLGLAGVRCAPRCGVRFPLPSAVAGVGADARPAMALSSSQRKPKKPQRSAPAPCGLPRCFEPMHFGDRLRRVQIVGKASRTPGCRPSARRRLDAASNQARQRLLSLFQSLHRPVDRLAIMRAQHREPDHLARPVGQQSRMVTKLPSDFAIFSPSTCRKPLCIQIFAITSVWNAQRDCAISFS